MQKTNKKVGIAIKRQDRRIKKKPESQKNRNKIGKNVKKENWQNSNTSEEKIKQEILENKNGNKTENAKK